DVAEEGTASIMVAAVGGTSNAQTFTIFDPPVSPTGGFTFNAVEGASSSNQIVATFTDPAGAEQPDHYAATIDWGDGSSSAGSVTFSGGVFTVSSTHLYTEQTASKTIAVTIAHESAPAETVISTAVVS